MNFDGWEYNWKTGEHRFNPLAWTWWVTLEYCLALMNIRRA